MNRWTPRSSHLKWLRPGMGVKRWVVMMLAGVVAVGLGLASLFEALEQTAWSSALVDRRPPFWNGWPFTVASLLAGGLLVTVGIVRLNRSLLSPFRRTGQGDVVDVVYRHRQRQRGPRVVALGGGHGLSTLLRGLKEHTDNITAIVTVADDGGSSGRLRRELGMLPPGDFRNCIAALSDAEGLMAQLFQYRFGDEGGLAGHSFGNLYITAMAAITGSFESALNESGRVLAVRGRVLPATLTPVQLCADVWVPDESGRLEDLRIGGLEKPASSTPVLPRGASTTSGGRVRMVCGESRIPTMKGRIRRVYLDREDAPAYPETIRAILEADLIVAGPGSLYTSVLPNLLVPDIAEAIRAAKAPRVYICNVATQPGETDGYDVSAHMQAIMEHLGPGVFDTVLANEVFSPDRSPGGGAEFVRLPAMRMQTPPAQVPLQTVQQAQARDLGYHLVTGDLVDAEFPWRHDPSKLAGAVMEFLKT